jgi:asparagine synthase (glutamine-hydrolysing)
LGNFNLLKNIIKYGYSPLLTPTGLALGSICKKIKRDKNRVLLSGIGGDELFGGYYVNFLSHILSYKNKNLFNQNYSLWKKNISKFIRNPNLKNFKAAKKLINKFRLNFFIEENLTLNKYIKKLKKNNIKKLHNDIFYNNMLQNIFYQSLPAQLFQSDYVCMYFSIENRSPFLSKKLFEYVYKVKKNLFMYNGIPKAILRKSMENFFPPEIKYDLEKVGFYSPFRSLFNKKEIPEIKKYLLNSKILKKNIYMSQFQKLLMNNNIFHVESKFIFACLNIAVLEQLINDNK